MSQGTYQDWKKWDICCALLLIKRHLDLRKVRKSAKATPQNIFFSKIEFSVIVNRRVSNFDSNCFGDIQKVRSHKIPEIWPPPPCSPMFVFEHPLPPPGTFVLARTPPLSSVSILVKFREKKLIMITSIFGWTQHVFYKATVESL